jgi:cytoplasmic tRNA 2-thiolation protein 2
MNNDKYKVKFGESITREKVLFPLSLGKSSLVLLDILIALFDEQKKNPRAKIGFEIEVVHIDDSRVNKYSNTAKDLINGIKSSYNIDNYPIKFTVLKIQSFINRDNLALVRLLPNFISYMIPLPEKDSTIEKIFDGCPNRASKHDLLRVIVNNMIKSYALAAGASSILWGHSMSTLASEVIALTVKGRGSEIYSNLTDDTITLKGKQINIIHPLRDCSDGEIDKYVAIRDLEKFVLQPTENVNKLMNKQKTINEVVSNYYKTVDGADDNIVSTVVKTGAKLDKPKNFDNKICSICDNKIYSDPMNWLRNITYKGNRGPESEIEEESYKEWVESNKNVFEELENSERMGVDLCFGCAVTVGGLSSCAVAWPVRQSEKDIQDILDDFIIDDE